MQYQLPAYLPVKRNWILSWNQRLLGLCRSYETSPTPSHCCFLGGVLMSHVFDFVVVVVAPCLLLLLLSYVKILFKHILVHSKYKPRRDGHELKAASHSQLTVLAISLVFWFIMSFVYLKLSKEYPCLLRSCTIHKVPSLCPPAKKRNNRDGFSPSLLANPSVPRAKIETCFPKVIPFKPESHIKPPPEDLLVKTGGDE